jgi:apolipoprotein N-acyltransferase
VALLQPSLDQRIQPGVRTQGGNDSPEFQKRQYTTFDLHWQAVALDPPVDLIIWPETTYPLDWWRSDADVPLEWMTPKERQAITICDAWPEKRAQEWRTNVLLGLNSYIFGGSGNLSRYNSALLFTKDGKVGGRYDKFHRVPFGEYLPFRESIPLMRWLSPYDFDYSIQEGRYYTRFPLKVNDQQYFFGALICFEEGDPLLAREYLNPRTGPPVNFLVNLSNDGWFDGSAEHDEQLAISRFRAVECRRSLARAVNMGISAVVDGSGRVVAIPGESWTASKKIETVLVAQVPIDRRTAWYPILGDWLPMLAWVLFVVGMLIAKVRAGRAVQPDVGSAVVLA